MIRKLLAACSGPLLLTACAGAVAIRPAEPPGSYEFVEAIRDYAKPRDVPAAFQHLVDWHTGTEPVVLLLAAGGRRACAVTPIDASRVLVGRRYSCRWSGAR